MQLQGTEFAFHESTDGLVLERSQAIDSRYIDSLKAERAASLSGREGNFMRVASIPVAIVDKWKREGFDVFLEPARAIVARLNAESLDDFITTNKKV